MAQKISLSPVGSVTGAKQKSQALAEMLVKREVHPTGLVQDKSQNSLRSVASGEQDVVEPNKNGVKERAKALALLEKAKEESKLMAQNVSLSPAGSATGATQRSQALAKMLVKREVHPTGLVQSKSQRGLGLKASEKQDVVEENKNGVIDWAKALGKLQKTKEESKSVARTKSQPATWSATVVREESQARSMMPEIIKEYAKPTTQNKWQTTSLGASEKQDVVEGNKNGVREKAKALAMLEKAKEQPKFTGQKGQRRSSLWS
jgi:hypothetical protein